MVISKVIRKELVVVCEVEETPYRHNVDVEVEG